MLEAPIKRSMKPALLLPHSQSLHELKKMQMKMTWPCLYLVVNTYLIRAHCNVLKSKHIMCLRCEGNNKYDGVGPYLIYGTLDENEVVPVQFGTTVLNLGLGSADTDDAGGQGLDNSLAAGKVMLCEDGGLASKLGKKVEMLDGEDGEILCFGLDLATMSDYASEEVNQVKVVSDINAPMVREDIDIVSNVSTIKSLLLK